MGEPDEKSNLIEKEKLGFLQALKALVGIRLVALFCICFLTFGSYFTYDIPGALGYGVVCNIEPMTGASTKATSLCFKSENFNFFDAWVLGPNFCPAKKSSVVDKSGWSSCIISKDEPAYTSMTAAACMADCWRSSPFNKDTPAEHDGWRAYGTQMVDHNSTFDLCMCGKAITKEQLALQADEAYCNHQCNGADSAAKSRPESWHCGGLNYMTVGQFYCRPQTIEMHFRETKGVAYSNTENLTLYSVYSYPNAILALLGGMLVDKLGLRSASLLFVTCILIGQIVFALGIKWALYPLMIAGRIIFGLGGESLTVAQSTYTARWFQSTGFMALAFGISLSFSRIGSSVGFMSMPYFAQEKGVMYSVWLGTGACGVSWLMTLLMNLLDRYGEKKQLVDDISSDEPFKLKDLRQFGIEMWLITGITIFYYIGIFPFNGIGKNFFNAKWHVDMVTAGSLVAVYTFTAAGGSPIIGLAVDRSGRALWFMFLGCVISIGCYLAMWLMPGSYSPIPPAMSMVGIGISVTLLGASLWPAVPYIVDQRVLGSAYGVMTAVQNFGLAVTPQIIGVIRDKTKQQGVKSYYYCLFVLMFCGVIGSLCALGLMIVNGRKDKILLVSSTQRDVILNERRKKETSEDAIN